MMSEPQLTVQVTGGIIRGTTTDGGTRVFLGVPYAAAPVGAARFQPPAPVTSWEGIRAADRFGPTVPKGRLTPHFEQMWPERWIPGDESLNLNIWAPANADDAPVLVWIHGGGFTNGSGSSRELDGTAFAATGIVCVTINYRLGADGFLVLGDGVANVGLLDQISALRWVRDNIARFGGDPGRVTLAGHSAGGCSVACLLSSAHAEGLFARAIVQSTSGISRLGSVDFAERVGRDLAARLGIEADRRAFATVPTPELLTAMEQQRSELREWGGDALVMAPWAPVADGEIIPIDAAAALRSGRGSDIPLLTGTSRDELRLYLTPDGIAATTEGDLEAGAAEFGLTPHDIAVYRRNRPDASSGDLLAAIQTDWYFRRPAVWLAEARDAGGATDTWMYRFDRPQVTENGGYGAAHGVDIPFIFRTTTVGETHARIGPQPAAAVEALMHGLWVDYINGNPMPWPSYDPASRMTGILTDRHQAVSDPDGLERTTWVHFR